MNSLTQSKVDFIPMERNIVKWYICGPTVYDYSHLGHARSYITFDIIRRIMEDYFGYELQVVMNITDIDDKIIIKSRRNYLVDKFKSNNPQLTDSVIKTLQSALEQSIANLEGKLEGLKKSIESGVRSPVEAKPELDYYEERVSTTKGHLESLKNTKPEGSSEELIEKFRDNLGEVLDKDSDSISNDVIMQITKELSSNFEKEFLKDMKALGIKPPDVLTRVSEYVQEIIEMIEGIIKNGFAYESDGSVYFDTSAFDSNEKHDYAKLSPTSVGNKAALAEGEGALSSTGERKSLNDFALWKKSKPGEPSWDSPWGKGRPGWHIECSAMATNILGDRIDIHGGGSDLKFPHHDNELAQSEAYSGQSQWVNYFLHAGHLHINGLKMSKSLKNFITIREILESHSSRQIRLLFLLQQWDSVMNYSKDTMTEVLAKEKNLKEFFRRIDNIIDERESGGKSERWNEQDKELNEFFLQKQKDVHHAICDNFGTKQALDHIFKLISKCNIYIESNTERKAYLLRKIAVYITKILKSFGLIEGNEDYGFPSKDTNSSSDWKENVKPFVNETIHFRNKLREITKSLEKGEAKNNLFKLTDELRDNMRKLGIMIVDNGAFPFYFVDSEEWKEQERLEAEKAQAKNAKKNQSKKSAPKKEKKQKAQQQKDQSQKEQQ